MEPLLENTKESLIDAGCKPREFHFPEGGLYDATLHYFDIL